MTSKKRFNSYETFYDGTRKRWLYRWLLNRCDHMGQVWLYILFYFIKNDSCIIIVQEYESSHKTLQHLFLTFDFDSLSMSVLYPSNHVALLIILVYKIRNISNDNGFFIFYVEFFFPLSLPRLLLDLTVYIWIIRWVSYKKQELLTLREHLSSPTVF